MSVNLEATTVKNIINSDTLNLVTTYSGGNPPSVGALLTKGLKNIFLKGFKGKILLKSKSNNIILDDKFRNWSFGVPFGWGLLNPYSQDNPNLITLEKLDNGVKVICDGSSSGGKFVGFGLKGSPILKDLFENRKSINVRIEISGKLLKGTGVKTVMFRKGFIQYLNQFIDLYFWNIPPDLSISTESEDKLISIVEETYLSYSIYSGNEVVSSPIFFVADNMAVEFELYSVKIIKI